MRLFKILTLLLGLSLYIQSCNKKPNVVYSIPRLDSVRTTFKIPINKLVNDFKNWDGQIIETTGVLHCGFEQFVISADSDLLPVYATAFWLDPRMDLNADYNYLQKMNGKLIRVKGIMDISSRGHLSQYLATIKGLYFLEVE